MPPRKETVADYERVFGKDSPRCEAVLEEACRAAGMSAKLCGDNMANSAELSDKEAMELAREAYEFVTKYMEALFGVSNTTLMHRLAYNLLDELRLRGNIVEADTGINEMLHTLCKVMYARTNKQEEEYELRLLRADQALAFFVGEMREKSIKAAVKKAGLLDDQGRLRDVTPAGMAADERIGMDGRLQNAQKDDAGRDSTHSASAGAGADPSASGSEISADSSDEIPHCQEGAAERESDEESSGTGDGDGDGGFHDVDLSSRSPRA